MDRRNRRGVGRCLQVAGLAALMATAGLQIAQAQEDASPKQRTTKAQRVADSHPLTVRRIARPPVVDDEDDDAGPGFLRDWDDPRLDTFFGWRLGGDNFYGDERGDPITRGNASLGAISGYGGANGGYGGPHFDSVGGFHNGPGPGAQEANDYASGSISRPVYNRPLPQYPSLKTQVADLDTGIAGTGQVGRKPTAHERWASLNRTRATTVRATQPDIAASFVDPEDDDPDF